MSGCVPRRPGRGKSSGLKPCSTTAIEMSARTGLDTEGPIAFIYATGRSSFVLQQCHPSQAQAHVKRSGAGDRLNAEGARSDARESRGRLQAARRALQTRTRPEPHLQAWRADGVPAGAGNGAAALGRWHADIPGTQVRAAALEAGYAQAAGARHAGGAEAGRHHVLGAHSVHRRPGPPQAGLIIICDFICTLIKPSARHSAPG